MLALSLAAAVLAVGSRSQDQRLHKLEASEDSTMEPSWTQVPNASLPIQKVKKATSHTVEPLQMPDTILVSFPELSSVATTDAERAAVASALAHPIIIGYSARAASTLAFEIYAQHVGMLAKSMMPDAINTAGWIHSWPGASRDSMEAGTVAPRTLSHPPTIEQIPSLKITMNPYRRAVASYWHQIYYDFGNVMGDARAELVAAMNPKDRAMNDNRIGSMHAALGIANPETDRWRVSFLGWLNAVKQVGFDVLDIHSQPQYSKIEREGHFHFDHVCHIEGDLSGCLKKVGLMTGAMNLDAPPRELCDQEPLASVSDTCKHETTKHHFTAPNIAAKSFSALCDPHAETLTFPLPSDFYLGGAGATAKALVAELYHADFETYAYTVGDTQSSTIDG